MVLGGLTLLLMAIIAYAFWREGPLTSFAMCANVLIAGLLAFNFFEPIAGAFESAFADTFLQGTEDALAMMAIFLPVLMLLRWITNSIASTHMEYPPILYRGGSVVFGLLTGYLLAGILICMMLTLPVQPNFLEFEPYVPPNVPGKEKSSTVRKILPPDVVWLATLRFVSDEKRLGSDQQFDPRANYELRYERFRRFKEDKPMPYHGEIDP